MSKRNVLTEKEQKVAVDILEELILLNCPCGDLIDRLMEKYELMRDPFTCLPCTPKEYSKNSLEYDKQTMIERYGHCDGLD